MRARVVLLLFLAVLIAVVVVSGTAAADPGTHEVQITNGSGDVNASYYYDASAGSINVTEDGGATWTNSTLTNSSESALAIQWAVDNATATHDKVLVGPGTYNGTTTITHDGLSLEGVSGDPGAVLAPTANDERRAINVSASNVSVSSVTFVDFDSGNGEGLRFTSGSDNSVTDSTFRDSTYGVWVSSGSVTVENNTFESVGGRSVSVVLIDDDVIRNNTITDSYSTGLHFHGSSGNLIAGNVVENSSFLYAAIRLSSGSSDNTVEDNVLRNIDGTGVWIDSDSGPSKGNVLSGNRITSGTETGVLVEGPSTTIDDNKVTGNGAYGIHVQSVNQSVITANNVSANGEMGVYLNGSHHNSLEANWIQNNDWAGIYLEGAPNATIRSNTILDNNGAGSNPHAGISVQNSTDVVVDDNVVRRNRLAGMRLRWTDRVRVIDNRVTENCGGQFGIMLADSADALFVANNVSNNTGAGFQIFADSPNATVRDTRINDNGDFGFDGEPGVTLVNVTSSRNGGTGVHPGSDATLTTVTVEDNAGRGLNVDWNATIAGLTASGNRNEEVRFDGNATVTDMTVGGVHFSSLKAYMVDIDEPSPSAPTSPDDREAVGNVINMTSMIGTSWVDLTMTYTDGEANGAVESTIALHHFNGTTGSWEAVDGSSLDAGTNAVSANVTSFSTFQLLADEAASSGGGGGGGGGGYYIPPSSDSGPEFAITSIDLSNDAVAVGETVTVTVDVDNDGDEHGDYTGTLTADGQSVDTGTVTVNSNWHETLRLSTTFDQPGTYQLAVDGESAGSVEVTGASAFSVSDVSMNPTSVESGGTVTISATVTNDGSAEGTIEVPLTIDGEEVDSRSVTLGAGESETVSFERTFDEPGSVSIGGVTAGSVEMQTGSGDGGGDGGSDGGVGLVVFLFGGFGLVAVGLAGAYFLYPEEVLEAWQQVQSKVEDLTGGSR